ncbi:MAG: squalene synthase HpnC [Nitrospinota bacterium]
MIPGGPVSIVQNRAAGESLAAAYERCRRVASRHYENFPVGSWLLPRKLRPHMWAIYAFARAADDFADEGLSALAGDELGPPSAGPTSPERARLERLAQWGARLERCLMGEADHPVFLALGDTIRRFVLPPELFRDLLSAFRQDVTKGRYASFEELLDYCRRSANPVGRLVLLLHGVRDPECHRTSDAICTALQLANLWQDVASDLRRGRIYLPQEDLERFGVEEAQLQAGRATEEFRALMCWEVARTRTFFARGLPLLAKLRGRLGCEVRAIWRGGMAALDRVEGSGYEVFRGRPRLRGWDRVRMLGAALLPPGRLARHPDLRDPHHSARQFCRRLTRASGSNFLAAFPALRPRQRRGLYAVYAFCRRVDDLADGAGPLEERRGRLESWRAALESLLEVEQRDPVLRELAWAAGAFSIPLRYFLDLCEGVTSDLEARRFPTFEELQTYCHQVGSAVGLICVHVFGCPTPRAKSYALYLGVALQLTNILRDLRADALRGRLYLPLEDLEQFGVQEEEVRVSLPGGPLRELLAFEAARAHSFYDRARELLPPEARRALFPAEVMAAIYRELLRRMEREGFRCGEKRLSLSPLRKLSLALGAWARCRFARGEAAEGR